MRGFNAPAGAAQTGPPQNQAGPIPGMRQPTPGPRLAYNQFDGGAARPSFSFNGPSQFSGHQQRYDDGSEKLTSQMNNLSFHPGEQPRGPQQIGSQPPPNAQGTVQVRPQVFGDSAVPGLSHSNLGPPPWAAGSAHGQPGPGLGYYQQVANPQHQTTSSAQDPGVNQSVPLAGPPRPPGPAVNPGLSFPPPQPPEARKPAIQDLSSYGAPGPRTAIPAARLIAPPVQSPSALPPYQNGQPAVQPLRDRSDTADQHLYNQGFCPPPVPPSSGNERQGGPPPSETFLSDLKMPPPIMQHQPPPMAQGHTHGGLPQRPTSVGSYNQAAYSQRALPSSGPYRQPSLEGQHPAGMPGHQPPLVGSGGHGPIPGYPQGVPGYKGPQEDPRGQAASYDQPQAQSVQSRLGDVMPYASIVMAEDQSFYKNQVFLTNGSVKTPPLATTKCCIQDTGNASPRFIRSTMYTIPCKSDLANAIGIPIGLVVQPLAELPPNEAPLQVVNHGPEGPVRCNRCKAYMSPNMRFTAGGRSFHCNICSHGNEVRADYFCHLDHSGHRLDMLSRPELCLGSYEMNVTLDYCKGNLPPQSPAYIFMIDVSYHSVQSGLLKFLSKELGALLDCLPTDPNSPGTAVQVAFVTYDNSVHFYNLKACLAQPQMIVVSDIDDAFVPIQDGFFVNASESRSVINSFLEQLPSMFASTRTTDVLLGPALQAGLDSLKTARRPGKMILFHCSLPTMEAPGKLKNREDRSVLGTDKEKNILLPQSKFYKDLAVDCSQNGVGIDLFLIPNSQVDIATLSVLSTMTGGQIFKYPRGKESFFHSMLLPDLQRLLRSRHGFETIMRLRCSAGLRPVEFYGGCFMDNSTDVILGNLPPTKAMAIELRHDDKISDTEPVHFQLAILYTTIFGQRLVRVHNFLLNATSDASACYPGSDQQAVAVFMLKQAIHKLLLSNPVDISDAIVSRCTTILSHYRQVSKRQMNDSVLLLPENLKLLPLYCCCLLNSDVLFGGQDISPDDKALLLAIVQSLGVAPAITFLHPNLYALHELMQSDQSPSVIRCSLKRLEPQGAYLLDNGIRFYLWLGSSIPHEFVQQVFGVSSPSQLEFDMIELQELDNPLSRRIRSFLHDLSEDRRPLMAIIQQRGPLESFFKRFMVEDRGFTTRSMAYAELTVLVFNEVKQRLSN